MSRNDFFVAFLFHFNWLARIAHPLASVDSLLDCYSVPMTMLVLVFCLIELSSLTHIIFSVFLSFLTFSRSLSLFLSVDDFFYLQFYFIFTHMDRIYILYETMIIIIIIIMCAQADNFSSFAFWLFSNSSIHHLSWCDYFKLSSIECLFLMCVFKWQRLTFWKLKFMIHK